MHGNMENILGFLLNLEKIRKETYINQVFHLLSYFLLSYLQHPYH